MPELPEVQTVVDSLRPKIKDLRVIDVEIKEKKMIAFPDISGFKEVLINNQVKTVRRRGKYIIIELADGHYLVTHLRMTGQLIYSSDNSEEAKYTYIIIQFDNQHQLRFINKRKFGRMYLVSDLADAGSLTKLGPEPLEDDFTFDKFKALFDNRTGMIKPLLLNQKFLAGLGNIYVDESLHLSHVHPERKANRLTEKELKNLYKNIRKILREGIKYRGTTKWDYVDSSGNAGEYQNHLKAYDREGEVCYTCDTPLNRIKVGGRSSYFCPQCQSPDK
ncbi:bifunctional DNA-formamidopyrimidine glycosylase/DNA-(apurinic or apyrimidinic site) lyase [Selenihalanaerobacter shriftii]|uniref:Formamidopyrimidine-DNA glycosylase n=1 Tax=Selenihalanaerobacter shriftii TaxID=142842 RepID=A0A1T4KCV1_9FIRM|nr:bifunctional DNA-formamidopyrimidine glycosylase/DNA-(apurinic or apyrimidinic site) lyase [Selenihalanaerobacter shriftii]SJZ40145.1 DNA-(apurinic or apyrimidinic site) lyase [Selenihalanaerobacter shriftii]